ncbi:hypothetical protein GSU75_05813 [Pseudomonas savastanoi pv. phaseolicola]|nr:hypothetical protein [Pseudomonas savastanoi pv. phaseolicola]
MICVPPCVVCVAVLRPLRENPAAAELEEAAKAVGQLTTPLRDMQVLAAFLEEQGLNEAAFQAQPVLGKCLPQGCDVA